MRSEELNAPRQWNGPHFHLIHRGAVPLPLIGATADAVLTSSTAERSPFPS